ncbi:MAG: FtsX-like permease family protein [bacterium]
MDKFFIVKLAFRNLWSHKLRTSLTLIGIVIGISAVVFLVSFSAGIQRLVTSQITNGDAYSLIDVGTGNSQVVKLNDDLLSKIHDIQGVKQIEATTNFGGKAKKDGQAMDIAVFGISSGTYLDWSGTKIRWGQNLKTEQQSANEVIINTSYAAFVTNEAPESLIGQKIIYDLVLPKELSPTGEAQIFPNIESTILGIIKNDASPSLYSDSSNFLNAGANGYSQLKVMIDNKDNISEIRQKIEAYGLKTEYAGDIVTQVQQFFNVFQIILGGFGLIALIVALLGMFNTLTISLLERIKEVALMEIFGMGKNDIRNLFLTEAISLGFVGGILGILWGIILGKTANYILNIFATRAGGNTVTIFYYAPLFLVGAMIAAILVGFLTGIYPAIRASKVKPLDVLRYE